MRHAKNDREGVPNLVYQFRKSIDMNGENLINFVNGDVLHLHIPEMQAFLLKYEKLKPCDREDMEKTAVRSYENFKETLTSYDRPSAPKSIYSGIVQR